MKHAWLIIAHNEFGILQRLVSALDAPQCDIYIHIDKKVKHLPNIRTKYSRLFCLTDRIDVRWGSVSQIRCELFLFETAAANGPYDYYHVISGTTLPLKPLSIILAFFQGFAGNNIFAGLGVDPHYQETLKMRRFNLFLRNYSSPDPPIKKLSQFLWKCSIAVQRLFGIEANRGKFFYKASNWLSLTEEAVQYLLSRKKEILKTYRYSFCGDEYFVPSELMASPLRDTLISDEHYLLHNIARSNASVYHISELEDLRKTEYLFARKFTEQ